MKVQITLLMNVDIDPANFECSESATPSEILETVRDFIDDGNISADDLMERSMDYTVTVVESDK